MLNRQTITEIKAEELLVEVEKKRKDGKRLVQISCTINKPPRQATPDTPPMEGNYFEITYSFEDGMNLENLRLDVPETMEIESISGIYSFAFLYENEMKDLFGVKFNNLLVDFGGNLYKTAIKTPFNHTPPKEGNLSKEGKTDGE